MATEEIISWGLQGPAGPMPTLSVGDVETGVPGSEVEVTLTGPAAAPQLNVKIPRGESAPLVTPTQFGGVGDGVANDTAAVAAAIAFTPGGEIYLPEGKRFLVTALSNPTGIRFTGPGEIRKAITGGQQKLNSYADQGPIIAREYMAPLHNKMLARLSGDDAGLPIKIVCTGDSTTAGVGADPDFYINNLVANAARSMGLRGVGCINRGQPSKNTLDWISTYLPADLALGPDALVIGWGANDAPIMTAAESLALMRTALASIRAVYPLAVLALMVCAPSTMSDTPNKRDEVFFEQWAQGAPAICREFQAEFVDKYAYCRDARNAATWMDSPPELNGAHIHPGNVMNTWLAGLITDALFPPGFVRAISRNRNINISGAFETKAVADPLYYYDYGTNQHRATGEGWPFDGTAFTARHADEIGWQVNYPYLDNSYGNASPYATRNWRQGRWTDWDFHNLPPGTCTPAAGFSQGIGSENMQCVRDSKVITGKGFVVVVAPGPIAAGTAIATVPIGYRPSTAAYGVEVLAYNGTTFTPVQAKISGVTLELMEAVSVNAQRLYFGRSTWSIY